VQSQTFGEVRYWMIVWWPVGPEIIVPRIIKIGYFYFKWQSIMFRMFFFRTRCTISLCICVAITGRKVGCLSAMFISSDIVHFLCAEMIIGWWLGWLFSNGAPPWASCRCYTFLLMFISILFSDWFTAVINGCVLCAPKVQLKAHHLLKCSLKYAVLQSILYLYSNAVISWHWQWFGALSCGV